MNADVEDAKLWVVRVGEGAEIEMEPSEVLDCRVPCPAMKAGVLDDGVRARD